MCKVFSNLNWKEYSKNKSFNTHPNSLNIVKQTADGE